MVPTLNQSRRKGEIAGEQGKRILESLRVVKCGRQPTQGQDYERGESRSESSTRSMCLRVRRTLASPPSSLQPRPCDALPRACAHAWPRPCPPSPATSRCARKPRGPKSRLPSDPPTLCSVTEARCVSLTLRSRSGHGAGTGEGPDRRRRLWGRALKSRG